jgi:formylglycine-generating enzyme required for sulfatase activity
MNAINPTQLKAKRLLRLERGGSWRGDARYARASGRVSSVPSSRDDYLGFRLVRNRWMQSIQH